MVLAAQLAAVLTACQEAQLARQAADWGVGRTKQAVARVIWAMTLVSIRGELLEVKPVMSGVGPAAQGISLVTSARTVSLAAVT